MTAIFAATTPAEHAMVFASLAEPALIEHLRSNAIVQNTVALTAAFDLGIFNVRGLIDAVPELVEEGPKHRVDKKKQEAVYARMDEIVDGWAPRLSAATAFLRNGVYETVTSDPVLGALNVEMPVLVMGATTAFKSLFEKIALDAVDQMHRVLGSGKSNPSIREGRTDPLNESFAFLTAGAVVLDLPHVAAKIVDMSPDSPVTCFDSSWMGLPFGDLMGENRHFQINAAAVALQFSRIECLQAIKTASRRGGAMQPDLLLGREKLIDELDTDYRDVRFTQTLKDSLFLMACNPSTLKWALDDALRSKTSDRIGTLEKVEGVALDAISNDHPLHAFTPAFLAAGCYDRHAAEAVHKASYHGVAAIVEEAGNPPRMGNGWPADGRQTRSIDWKHFADTCTEEASTFYRTMSAIVHNVDGTLESCQALVRRAKNEGGLAHVLRPFRRKCYSMDDKTSAVAEPMWMTMKANQTPMVIAMLDAGVHPTEPLYPGALAPLAMAESLQMPEVSHAIRSWMLRESARQLLDGMNEPTLKATP